MFDVYAPPIEDQHRSSTQGGRGDNLRDLYRNSSQGDISPVLFRKIHPRHPRGGYIFRFIYI